LIKRYCQPVLSWFFFFIPRRLTFPIVSKSMSPSYSRDNYIIKLSENIYRPFFMFESSRHSEQIEIEKLSISLVKKNKVMCLVKLLFPIINKINNLYKYERYNISLSIFFYYYSLFYTILSLLKWQTHIIINLA